MCPQLLCPCSDTPVFQHVAVPLLELLCAVSIPSGCSAHLTATRFPVGLCACRAGTADFRLKPLRPFAAAATLAFALQKIVEPDNLLPAAGARAPDAPLRCAAPVGCVCRQARGIDLIQNHEPARCPAADIRVNPLSASRHYCLRSLVFR